MSHCGLTPRPPLQINRKIRKGSKLNKLKQNQTNPLVKASETMKTPDKNILEITKALKLFSRLKNQDNSDQTKYSNDVTILFPSITTIRLSYKQLKVFVFTR